MDRIVMSKRFNLIFEDVAMPPYTQILAAAYEVDDFVTVAGLNGGIGPLRAREDFQVAFNGDAAGGEIQFAQ
jgi:hypothetical protein